MDESNAVGKRVLNLGSRVGRFDHCLSEEVKTINLDISPTLKNLNSIGDAHSLPFKCGCFDVIYSIAVLEHVKRPWIVRDEIFTVLRSGGYVVLELPFLSVIHDNEDYFRFTDKGIRSLFDEARFDVICEQVGSGGGSFPSCFLLEYFEQFLPTKYIKTLWRLSMRYVFYLLKYLDLGIYSSKELRITTNSFSFIGRSIESYLRFRFCNVPELLKWKNFSCIKRVYETLRTEEGICGKEAILNWKQ